jgi:replicative DNA helicase
MCRLFEAMDGVYVSSLEWLKSKNEEDEKKAYEKINKMNIYLEPFDYESSFRIFDISKNVENPELIVVDGLRTFFPEGMSEDEKKDKTDDFMTDLKRLAEKVDCPVVLVTDLPPSVDERENKRPVLEDSEEAGCETALADTVIGLYRDSYYTKPSAWENGAELVILKYDGSMGCSLKVPYNPHTGLFRDEEKLIENSDIFCDYA